MRQSSETGRRQTHGELSLSPGMYEDRFMQTIPKLYVVKQVEGICMVPLEGGGM